MKEQKSGINPANLQAVLESGANAADKGQSQFFTPAPFARHLATALPRSRSRLVDLTCGRGDLLKGAAASDTLAMFGCDIDASPVTGFRLHKITADLTNLYPLLVETNWREHLFALNAPYDVHWPKARLAALSDSDCPAVAEAFAEHDPRAGKGMIDSTIATLLIALDRLSNYGEGFIIANQSTMDRLIFRDNAPHGALARHIWAHVICPGNPMTGIADANFREEYNTCILFFATEHEDGPEVVQWSQAWDPDCPPAELAPRYPIPRRLRMIPLREYHWRDIDGTTAWKGVAERLAEEAGAKPSVPWNLWLDSSGTIQCDLSLYENALVAAPEVRTTDALRPTKATAARLFALRGKRPMQLVMGRTSREELLTVAERMGWRVQPALLQAVRRAIQRYGAQRSPLRPLPPMQRLGYLDEENSIPCIKDLYLDSSKPLFKAGERYPVRTQTAKMVRLVIRPDTYTGAKEELEYTGQQLGFFLKPAAASAHEYAFFDAVLRDPNTTLEDHRLGRAVADANGCVIDFTTEQLCAHFAIPEVPDVAALNPEKYQANLRAIDALEKITEQLCAQ